MLNFGHLMSFLRKACPEPALSLCPRCGAEGEAEWAGIHFVVISSARVYPEYIKGRNLLEKSLRGRQAVARAA